MGQEKEGGWEGALRLEMEWGLGKKTGKVGTWRKLEEGWGTEWEMGKRRREEKNSLCNHFGVIHYYTHMPQRSST